MKTNNEIGTLVHEQVFGNVLLYELARDHVICMPIDDDLLTDPVIVEDLIRKLQALLIKVHNDALDKAQRVIGTDHPNTFDHLKYPPP